MTDAEAWSAFCSWQSADAETRLITFNFDASPDCAPAVRVRLSPNHSPKPIEVSGATLAECWRTFEKMPVVVTEAVEEEAAAE